MDTYYTEIFSDDNIVRNSDIHYFLKNKGLKIYMNTILQMKPLSNTGYVTHETKVITRSQSVICCGSTCRNRFNIFYCLIISKGARQQVKTSTIL